MLKHVWAGLLLLAAVSADARSAPADDAAALFGRYKEASGGARWDAMKTAETRGSLHAGGLDGTYRSVQDLLHGRSAGQYRLGPIQGADGYDGRAGWSRDPGGEVAVLDAEDARRRARSQAWLDAHGYWYPERHAARWEPPQVREADGRRYDVVTATPDGGDPLGLWFDPATHLLARVVQRQGQDTATTVFDDWRAVDGLSLPFRSVTDVADASGRVEPRQRTEVRVERVAWNVPVTDADFAAPAMAPTARIDNAAGVTRIPFELVNNHIYVDGELDGRKARFLVDTGGANLLTPAAAAKFGLKGEGKLAGRGAGDETVDVAFAHAKEVRVGDAKLAEPVFMIMSLGQLPAVEGYESDGLVGYEMFRRFGVTIDYARRELVLAEPAKFAPPPDATAVPFELAERIPIVAGRLDGLPLRISVDTGSRASLTVHSPFAKEHALVQKYRAAPEAVVGWGVGGPARGRPVRLGRLELGTVAVDGVAGDLYLGEKSAFAAPDPQANLGAGVLKRFTVAFDYAAKRMYLAPNADFAKGDPFDRSGLWLLGAGEALEVVDVAADSAAAGSQWRIGDRITAIDGEAVGKRSLSQWRQRLRELPAGTRLGLDYRRGGQPMRAELVLADRIPATSPAAGK
jgi:hypothetical protein